MNTKQSPPLVVAGLPRCGSSLVMSMLAAGGLDCVGAPPGYEDSSIVHGRPIDPQIYWGLGGWAIKVLDPHRNRLPTPSYQRDPHVVIWLDRNPIEQVKSQVKFARAAGLIHRQSSNDELKKMFRRARGLAVTDRHACMVALRGARMLQVRFESLVLTPRIEAERIARFVAQHLGRNLDVAAMDARVIRRNPACADSLQIELDAVRAVEGPEGN